MTQDHTNDDIKEAIKNQLRDRQAEAVDTIRGVKTVEGEGDRPDHIMAEAVVPMEEDDLKCVFDIPDIVQSVDFSTRRNEVEFDVVTTAEELGLEG